MDRKEKEIITRQQRREERLRKKKESMSKHGKELAQIYKDSALKKLKDVDKKKD